MVERAGGHRLAVVLVLALSGAALAGPRPSRLQPDLTGPGVSTDPFAPVVASCWVEGRPFSNLRHGNFTFCRGSLRYRPGALDCAQFVDQVCWVLLPGEAQWTQTRTNQLRTLIVCPPGPEPPVCPRFTP